MTDNSTGSTSNVGEEIEDCVEGRTELDSLILDDTEGVSCGLCRELTVVYLEIWWETLRHLHPVRRSRQSSRTSKSSPASDP